MHSDCACSTLDPTAFSGTPRRRIASFGSSFAILVINGVQGICTSPAFLQTGRTIGCPADLAEWILNRDDPCTSRFFPYTLHRDWAFDSKRGRRGIARLGVDSLRYTAPFVSHEATETVTLPLVVLVEAI
jgi:hypothetical protein